MWKFIRTNKNEEDYYLVLKGNEELCLQRGENDQLGFYERVGNNNQKWRVNAGGDEYYLIQNTGNWYCLDVWGAEKSNGREVIFYRRHGGDSQKWKFLPILDWKAFQTAKSI